MGLMDALNQFTRDAMDFLFPRKCPFCGVVVGKELICQRCSREMPRCDAVRESTAFGRCAAPFYYEDKVREALLAFKFNGEMGGLDCFGREMAQCAAEHYSGQFDAVTWVPVSKQRLKKRGFDQSRYLAGSLCVDWHTEPQETLMKKVDNPAQSGIDDADERKANVLGVYAPVAPEKIAGKRFLLIDDICTTGATLGECVRVLRDAGAADVMCLTLAITRKN